MKNVKRQQGASIAAAAGDAGKKRVGQVTDAERDEIRTLFERKIALLELFKSLADGDQLDNAVYEKVVADLGKVTTRFDAWWSAMRRKYQWESAVNGHWEIDFDDSSIYLLRNAGKEAGGNREETA
ncbi:MAG: CXXX repeat peptide modification system protein [Thermoguttaceae bacterium]|jgi:CXXX repeat modification system protein